MKFCHYLKLIILMIPIDCKLNGKGKINEKVEGIVAKTKKFPL